jgi:hypothetical protein
MADQPSNRRRFQFRLRMLLIVIAHPTAAIDDEISRSIKWSGGGTVLYKWPVIRSPSQ